MVQTFIVISECFKPISSDRKKSSGHHRGRMRGPHVGLLVPLLLAELVPLEVHPPVHQAEQVLADEPVVQGRVVDGVDHGGDDQLQVKR